MVLRPYGIIFEGQLQQGVEVVMADGQITEVRAHTGIPENYVLSAAFVNAHSHLEYRGMQDKVKATEYWPWIQEVVEFKRRESEVRVRQEAIAAAHENHRSGVALLAEHSDRPFAATAMMSAGLEGAIFQEAITIFDQDDRFKKLGEVRRKAMEQAKLWRRPIFLTPHAYQTVDRQTLSEFGGSGEPISIHVAETPLESTFTVDGTGSIGDFYRQHGVSIEPTGKAIVPSLRDLGLVRKGVQFVHCCDLGAADIRILADAGVAVAHCPRSNQRLNCPPAPIREMLDAGIMVGLGMDSPASSGAIDMFAEMRCALRIAEHREKHLRPEEVWRMATDPAVLRFAIPNPPCWDIKVGTRPKLIKIQVPDASCVRDVIEHGSPAKVSWA